MENTCRLAARRGALWTSPIWLSTLWFTAVCASPRFDALMQPWPNLGTALSMLSFFGSSFCFLSGFLLTSEPLDAKDALKKGLASGLAPAFAYFLFAFFIYLYGQDEKSPAWGGAFGLLAASGTFVASALGALAKLGYQYITKTVLNPYKKPEPLIKK